MAQESQRAREVRILKNIVLAAPRALRWMGQQFSSGVRAGLASAQETAQQSEQRKKQQDG